MKDPSMKNFSLQGLYNNKTKGENFTILHVR